MVDMQYTIHGTGIYANTSSYCTWYVPITGTTLNFTLWLSKNVLDFLINIITLYSSAPIFMNVKIFQVFLLSIEEDVHIVSTKQPSIICAGI